MPDTKTTEAEVVYQRIEELKAEGVSNADAIRAVAKERGKSENAVRANQHQHRQKLGGSAPGSAPRGRRGRSVREPAMTVESAVAQARAVLQRTLDALGTDVDAARVDLDAAQARYDELVASIKDQKAELERKIEALS